MCHHIHYNIGCSLSLIAITYSINAPWPPSCFRCFQLTGRQLQPDIISWGSLIGAQGWQQAMQLVEGAQEASVRRGNPQEKAGWVAILWNDAWNDLEMVDIELDGCEV